MLPYKVFKPYRSLKLNRYDKGEKKVRAGTAKLISRLIDLFVKPAIVYYSDARGKDYSEQRNLIQSVMWIVKSEDLVDGISVGCALS